MSKGTRIYVALVDEGVDVWKPVIAEHLNRNVYQILDQPYDREAESWQFEPGEIVLCEMIKSSEGLILAAVTKADEREFVDSVRK